MAGRTGDAELMADRSNGSTPIVVVRDVHKSFGDVHALAGVSLEIERGTVLGLLGPNGAGKTTLVRVLTTLLDPDEGSATVAGYDVRRERTRVRPLIGLAGQSAAIDDTLTGRENLEMVANLYHMGRATAAARAGELLARFDLLEAADRRPGRIRAGCGGGWTWRRAWWPIRRCCSWTSRRPGWIRRRGWSCGR